jgi:hypothetical protein
MIIGKYTYEKNEILHFISFRMTALYAILRISKNLINLILVNAGK